jgi:hypothetical protein
MTDIQCDYVDDKGIRCTNVASQKCTGAYCGHGIYCVRHIQLTSSTYICDLCIKKADEIHTAAAKEADRIRRLVAIGKEERDRYLAEVAAAEAAQKARENRIIHPIIGIGCAIPCLIMLYFIAELNFDFQAFQQDNITLPIFLISLVIPLVIVPIVISIVRKRFLK